MKKAIYSTVAASLLLGSTASAAAQPAIALDRDAATIGEEAEGVKGGTLLIIVLVAVAIGGAIFLIEESEDDDDLPTSP